MKNLLKLLIVVMTLTFSMESYAQTFGAKAGLNLSNMLVKDNDDTYSDDFTMNPGFHIGVTAEFPINDMFSFETGLLYSTKGYKYDFSESFLGVSFDSKSTLNLYYLEIPLNAKVTFPVGGVNVYGALGPYVGFGLSGKGKLEITSGGQTETDESDIEWGSGDDADMKRLDFGLSVGAGVEFNSIQVGLSYGLGLANISADTENGQTINNRVLGISVGYLFNR